MQLRIRLALLIFFCAAAAIGSYTIEAIVGDVTTIDWRFWLASSPSILVRLIFGFLIENFKQFILFSFLAVFTDILFVIANFYFEPEKHVKGLEIFGGSLIAYLVFNFVVMITFSAILFCIGMLIAYCSRRFCKIVTLKL